MRVVGQLRTNLNGLEQKEQELAEKYNDNNLVMVNHRKETQVVREQLVKHEEQVRNTEMTKIQAELEPLLVKVAGLQKRYDEVAENSSSSMAGAGSLRTSNERQRSTRATIRSISRNPRKLAYRRTWTGER